MDGIAVKNAGQLQIPADATPKQLTELVNSLLGNDVKDKFAFYVEDTPVAENSDLRQLVQNQNLSTETVLTIKYQKLASFRVRPVSRCTDSMPGHTGAVLHVSFSPDGLHLVSGGGDSVVRFWDVHTATPRFACRGHKGHILHTAWCPSGAWFASGDMNGEIRVWNPTTGKMHRVLKGHKKWITGLAWEPMHRNKACERFVSCSKDMTLKIWNIRTGKCEVSVSGHRDYRVRALGRRGTHLQRLSRPHDLRVACGGRIHGPLRPHLEGARPPREYARTQLRLRLSERTL